MYTSFFGLNEKPFSITPDPRYLFMSERHSEALAHLVYGIRESGGFIQLTGEVGTGKTTLVRSVLQQLPEATDIALILNSQLSRDEFLASIIEELGIDLPANPESIKELTDTLSAFLLENHAKGRRTILMVDEAQNLGVDVLEQVRLLTNLETSQTKLLQIILIGQPELRDLLARNDMRQLAQRITGRYHLEPLSREESEAYIRHRLRVAGGAENIFTRGACKEIFKLSGGVPRLINVVADHALLGAFGSEEQHVSARIVKRAANEVLAPAPRKSESRGNAGWLAAAAVLVLAVGAGWWLLTPPAPQPAEQPSAQVPDTASQPVADQPVLQAEVLPPGISDAARVLNENGTLTGTDDAFASLFATWGANYSVGMLPACVQAEEFGLSCMFGLGTMLELATLDRPAILNLRDDSGTDHQVVLTRLDGASATIDLAGRRFEVSRDSLERYWFGEYLLLWRPEIGEVKEFFPGMQDPHVTWLRESLATIQDDPLLPIDSDVYDEILEQHVRDYQQSKRLDVDGLVGEQTQIVINSDLNRGRFPRLARNR